MDSLSNELLVSIFRMLADMVRDIMLRYDYFRWLPEYPCCWIAVTHVCRRWRAVAISCPMLWTFITTYDLPFIQTVLARSGQLPLQFRIDDREEDADEAVTVTRRLTDEQLGFSVFHRIYEYHLLGASAVGRFLQYASSNALPMLHTLWLDGDLAPNEELHVDEWQTPFPSLTDLTLRWLPVASMTNIISSSLRHLSLERAVPRISPQRCLQLLENTPLLETLSVSRALEFDLAAIDQGIPCRTVTLSHLSQLSLSRLSDDRFTEDAIFELFVHVICPADTRLRLAITTTDGSGTAFATRAMVEHLGKRLGSSGKLPMERCFLKIEEGWLRFQVLASERELFICPRPHCETHCLLDIDISLFLHDADPFADDFICQLLAQVGDPASVRELQIITFAPGRLTPYYDALRRLVNVEELDVSGERVVTDLLCPFHASSSSHDSNNTILFPHLTSLYVHHRFFDQPADSATIYALSNIVTWRRISMGPFSPLATLSYCQCCQEDLAHSSADGSLLDEPSTSSRWAPINTAITGPPSRYRVRSSSYVLTSTTTTSTKGDVNASIHGRILAAILK